MLRTALLLGLALVNPYGYYNSTYSVEDQIIYEDLSEKEYENHEEHWKAMEEYWSYEGQTKNVNVIRVSKELMDKFPKDLVRHKSTNFVDTEREFIWFDHGIVMYCNDSE